MQQYVKITKCTDQIYVDTAYSWYKDKIGLIVPVEKRPYGYQVVGAPYAYGCIEKHDCEPYQFPERNQEQEYNQSKKPAMEKQDTLTTYVRIINEHHRYYGLQYPVEEYGLDSRYWVILHGDILLMKEDCEVVALPPQTELIDRKDLAAKAQQYADADYHIPKDSYENQAVTQAFRSGYESAYMLAYTTAFDLGFKQAQRHLQTLPEGQHLITTEQLKTLVSYASYAAQEKFKEWFPAVFAPVKTTYQIGNQFAYSDLTLRIIGLGGRRVAMLEEGTNCICSAWDTVEVDNCYAITEAEMQDLTDNRYKDFTLLPESTDQMV